jgi:uracil-DNA glycosylase
LFAKNSLYRFFVFVKFKFVRTQGHMAKRVKEFLFSSSKGLEGLADEARDCKNCGLWQHATQTVFGKGSPRAKIVLVGEQPGEPEDVEGKPFIGPAGKLLDTLLVEAGVDCAQVYVINAVKHFKWELRGA